MDEPVPTEELPVGHVADPSLAVAVTLAELELLRAEIAVSQFQAVTGPSEPAIHDLSPLGRRQL